MTETIFTKVRIAMKLLKEQLGSEYGQTNFVAIEDHIKKIDQTLANENPDEVGYWIVEFI